jgi:hypothetical protein
VSALLRWLRSSLRGEVSTAELEARLRAGRAAYGLIEEADSLEGEDRSAQLFRVCAWAAFALQSIADNLIEADAASDPRTAGYVPRSTLLYVAACVDEVPTWIEQARVCQNDPSASPAGGLPARLPKWHHDEPTRPSELHGLRAAYEVLQARTEGRVLALPPARTGASVELRRVCAEMTTAAEYAAAVGTRHVGAVDRGEARWRFVDALQHAFLLGQLLALPTLVEVARVREEHDEHRPLAEQLSWLYIDPGWPVVDRDGVALGLVYRVCGDRGTGEFEGVDIASSAGSAGVHIPPAAIGTIGRGELMLSVTKTELYD